MQDRRDSIRGRESVRRGSADGRRGSTGGRRSSIPPPQVRPPNPEEAISNARARVVKLEAALVAVGEMDPLYPSLHGALKQAQSQARVRPV